MWCSLFCLQKAELELWLARILGVESKIHGAFQRRIGLLLRAVAARHLAVQLQKLAGCERRCDEGKMRRRTVWGSSVDSASRQNSRMRRRAVWSEGPDGLLAIEPRIFEWVLRGLQAQCDHWRS